LRTGSKASVTDILQNSRTPSRRGGAGTEGGSRAGRQSTSVSVRPGGSDQGQPCTVLGKSMGRRQVRVKPHQRVRMQLWVKEAAGWVQA